MKLMLVITTVLLIAGCATMPFEKTLAIRRTPKEYYNFNIATGTDVGMLLIQARPPAEQAINNYAIIIDSYEPLMVSKHSDTEITLDIGKHLLMLYAPSGGIFGDMFGKPTTMEVNIKKEQVSTIEYTGPYWAFSEGKIRKWN